MSLQSGERLGAYEIVHLLGSGGLGEVYRAVDTSLKRDVAIKVLPDSLALDADRLARFQREAEVLASLNHPNIAQIYGIERGETAKALVMELVEGPTWRHVVSNTAQRRLQAAIDASNSLRHDSSAASSASRAT